MLLNNSFNLIQLMRSKTVIRWKPYGFKPELRLVAFGFYMNMWWFIIFITEKEKTIATDS